jgi:hypothetical protein
MIRRESASGSFAYRWLKNKRSYAKTNGQENNMLLCLCIFCLSVCMPLLLPITVLVTSLSPALAAGNPAPDPQGYVLYTSGLCQSWTHDEVPQQWKDAGLCSAPIGQSFAQPGNGNCQQNWLAEMTVTGQMECVLTVPSLRSECPVGFALNAGHCSYEPVGRLGWEVGFCISFKAGEVPSQWITNHVCDTNPVPNPQQFTQSSGTGPCPQNFSKTVTQAGQQVCVLTIPIFQGKCPIGFAIQDGWCKYVLQDNGAWQVGLCKSFIPNEVPDEWITNKVCDTPSPNPETAFVQQSGNGSCQHGWVITTTLTGQQECVLTLPTLKGNACPIGFALHEGHCEYMPQNSGTWRTGLCKSFTPDEIPPEWITNKVCDIPSPNPETTFVQQSGNGSCQQGWVITTTLTGQQECILTLPTLKGNACPIGFSPNEGRCEYVPQNTGTWQVGFCKSFTPDQVPPAWMKAGVCNTNPIPDPETTFVQQSNNGSCQQGWTTTTTFDGQQECVLTLPTLKGNACPIGFSPNNGHCEYMPQNSGAWHTGLCRSFTTDEIPPEWSKNHVCDIPSPNPEQTFIKPGPSCQQNWIPTTAEATQVQCLLTIPDVRGLCPIGFALDGGRCRYVPQDQKYWQAGFCQSFNSSEVPWEWITNHICDVPSPDPEATFVKGLPCQPNWIETTNVTGQAICILTVPSIRGLCPTNFALVNGKCDYVPQGKTTWMIGFCKSFTSDEVPPEWIVNHVCDTNPVPDPEKTFIKDQPCASNWIRTAAEGGNLAKCALTVPAIRELCPIDFTLDKASCDYVPQKTVSWRFPCSDQPNGIPNESALSKDWFTGNSPDTQDVTSIPTTTDGTTGGRFSHTFAADTYGLSTVQAIFSYMLGLAFVLMTPMIILVGYQLMLASSSFRHAGILEGFSRILLGGLAIGVSFQLVTMLISIANVMDSAIVSLHAMTATVLSRVGVSVIPPGYYPVDRLHGISTTNGYMIAGIPEPATSYRGLVMPMSRWGCAVNDFIGILDTRFLKDQVASWFPVIGNLAPLTATVTNGNELVSRLLEFARMALSVVLWLQAILRIGLLNCYILTCPLAFACWSFPGGIGQQVIRQWARGFLTILFIQVIQLFLITTLPLVLPTFPLVAGDNGIMYVLLMQLPPLLVLWLTAMVPNFLGITASKAIGMTGTVAGGIVGAVGAAASLLG